MLHLASLARKRQNKGRSSARSVLIREMVCRHQYFLPSIQSCPTSIEEAPAYGYSLSNVREESYRQNSERATGCARAEV